jgi:hypothetical protein
MKAVSTASPAAGKPLMRLDVLLAVVHRAEAYC